MTRAAPELPMMEKLTKGTGRTLLPLAGVTQETDAGSSPATDEGTPEEVLREVSPSLPAQPGPTLARSLQLLSPAELSAHHVSVDQGPGGLMEHLQESVGNAVAHVQLQGEGTAEIVLPQVVRGLATLVRGGMAEMRLLLEPADLGEIELRVRTTRGVVRGEMMVQHAAVRELLQAHLPRLRESLVQEGLQFGGFDVDVERDPGSRDAEERGFHSTAGREPAARSAAPVSSTSPPESSRASLPGGSDKPGVDYTI